MSDWFGVPGLSAEVAWLRYALLLLALSWALAVARGTRWAALGAGLLYAAAAVGFWVFCLGRPYGLFEDAEATRRLAEASVAASSGGSTESLVAGEPVAFPVFVGLLRLGVPFRALRALPSVAPLLSLLGTGVITFLAWSRRADALAGACLWLAFPSGALESARGLGLVPGAWSRPEAALALPIVAGLALAAGRLRGVLGAAAAAAVALAALALPDAGTGRAPGDAVWALTLDQAPWLALAAIGWARAPDAAAIGLATGGAIGVLAGSVLPSADGWASLGLYRLGLLLSAAAVSGLWLAPLGAWLRAQAGRRAWAARWVAPADAPERLGLALVLALAVPGSFLAWWDPGRTDAAARGSLEAVSPATLAPMGFIALSTPSDAVFLASPDYAPAVAVFGGRRVLRAPSLLEAADDASRRRAEGAILAGRPLPPGAAGHGVRFVLLAPGDFKARGIDRPERLDDRPGFALRYQDGAGYRVYEIVR